MMKLTEEVFRKRFLESIYRGHKSDEEILSNPLNGYDDEDLAVFMYSLIKEYKLNVDLIEKFPWTNYYGCSFSYLIAEYVKKFRGKDYDKYVFCKTSELYYEDFKKYFFENM